LDTPSYMFIARWYER